ncbi:MAG: repair protein RecN [Actinomycetota bacterium]|jgi:DNA repair protein RecN (Recombination protein N)
MLVELSIENLGIIESSRISFQNGFTAFTGETGAGKTMLVEAINLVCGRRAETSVIRDGADEAHVEARFVRAGADGEEEEIILARTIHREGRSRAYINGRMATVASLSEFGEELVDIHGQHAHQRLLTAAVQRESLDTFAGIDLTELREAREAVTQIDAMLAALGGDEKSRARELDLLAFQCEEIETVAISSPTEDVELSQEEDSLADIVRHQESLWKASSLLSDDGAAIEKIGEAIRVLGIVSSMSNTSDRLNALMAEAEDVAHLLRTAAEGTEENPERLEFIRLRRQALRDLMRKYGDSLEDVMAFGVEARTRLDELTGYAERVQELESSKKAALATLRVAQLKVGDQRRKSAPALGKAVQARLQQLAMPNATVQVSVGDAESDPAGESVVFMLAANPGSAPQPLTKVASGGELARVMLSLRLVLTGDPATMVFDEVDAGIGGAAAVAVASALRELGQGHQVFAVTHLAQVGASAHQQISVSKTVRSNRTYGSATVVKEEDRAAEIARMLSGGVADDSAIAHARDLLSSLSVVVGAPKKGKGKAR